MSRVKLANWDMTAAKQGHAPRYKSTEGQSACVHVCVMSHFAVGITPTCVADSVKKKPLAYLSYLKG